MRICAAFVLLLLAGCTAPNRQAAVPGGPPDWDWPFQAPAWVRIAPEERVGYEDKPLVLLHCEFVDAGSVTSQLADLLDLSGGGAVVLSDKQADALKRIALAFGGGSIVGASRVLAFESQGACVAVVGPAGGRKVYLKSSDVMGDAASVRFAVQVVSPGRADGPDFGGSWRVEGQQALQVGQAVVCLGDGDRSGNPELVIVRLVEVGPPDKVSDPVARRHSITALRSP